MSIIQNFTNKEESLHVLKTKQFTLEKVAKGDGCDGRLVYAVFENVVLL